MCAQALCVAHKKTSGARAVQVAHLCDEVGFQPACRARLKGGVSAPDRRASSLCYEAAARPPEGGRTYLTGPKYRASVRRAKRAHRSENLGRFFQDASSEATRSKSPTRRRLFTSPNL